MSSAEKTILIVEDDPDMRSSLAFEVENMGLATLEAENGEQAFELLKSNAVDLILSDIRMPRWDGNRLLDELRKISKQRPPLIFISGQSNLSIKEAYDKGADAMLAKPFDPDFLVSLVNRLLKPLAERWLADDFDISNKLAIDCQFRAVEQPRNDFAIGRAGFSIATNYIAQNAVLDVPFLFRIRFESGIITEINGVGQMMWKSDGREGCLPYLGIEYQYLDSKCLNSVVNYINSQQMKHYIPALPKIEGMNS